MTPKPRFPLLLLGLICIIFALAASHATGLESHRKIGAQRTDSLTPGVRKRAPTSLPYGYPDLGVDTGYAPCDDFYQYTCRRWIDKHDTEATHEQFRTVFSELSKRNTESLDEALRRPPPEVEALNVVINARRFHSSCMDLQAIDAQTLPAAARPLLEPIDAWRSGRQTFSVSLGQLLSMGVGPLLAADTRHISQGCAKNNNNMTPWLMPDEMLANQTECTDALTSLAATIIHSVHPDRAMDEVRAASQKVTALERSLWGIRLNADTQRNLQVHGTWSQQMPRDAIHAMTGFLINPDELVPSYPAADITVQDLSFFSQLPTVLAGYSNQTVADHLTVGAMMTYGAAMPELIRTAVREYMKIIGTKWEGDGHRHLTCATLVSELFISVADRLFIDTTFSDATRKAVAVLMDNIKRAWARRLSSYTWFDKETSDAAVARVNNSISVIAYDDVIKNNTALEVDSLEAAYPPLGSIFLHNLIDCQQASFASAGAARIGAHRVFNTWVGDANAYCDYSRKGGYSLAVSAGMLQDPFFDARLPPVFNYGGIGFIIGHELSHGFDDLGSKYDATGQLRPWMGSDTAEEFHHRAEEMIKLYDSVAVDLAGESTHLHGQQTLGENIADNGGIRASWDAFQEVKSAADAEAAARYGQTADELFFVAYARTWCAEYTDQNELLRIRWNSHPPSPYRVLETLGSFPEFAAAYRCPRGGTYSKQTETTVWRRR